MESAKAAAEAEESARRLAVEVEKSKQARAASYNDTLSKLVAATANTSLGIEQLKKAVDENTATQKALIATSRGVINEADSRVIIESELQAVGYECARAYQISLRSNHYKGNEADIEEKMKIATSRIFDRAREKLLRFDMAVDPQHFFETTDIAGTRYAAVSYIWAYVCKFYENPVNYSDVMAAEERDARVQDVVLSVIRDVTLRGIRKSDNAYGDR
jgi:hypothetical protein